MTVRAQPEYRATRAGIEHLPGRFSLPRHRHLRPYATIVLSGTFEETGYLGRVRASAGDLLIHPAMDCHANQMVSSGVQLLRLDWPQSAGGDGYYRIDEGESLARVAEKDPAAASAMLRGLIERGLPAAPRIRDDWPDLLARALCGNHRLGLGAWALEQGLSRETVSRGFRKAYGITPAGFRAELRARSAWLMTTRTAERLSDIARLTGFADQAHMTRWVHRITGSPPAAWRRGYAAATVNGAGLA